MMDKWNKLVSSALVGTRNRPYLRQTGGTTLDELLSQINAEDEEQALLAAAAAMVIYREVGQVRVNDYTRKLPKPVAEETLPLVKYQALQSLEMILENKLHPRLLHDWMDAAQAANARLPEKYLLPMLERLTHLSESTIHSGTSQIIGERGKWLAKQRNKWHFVNWEADFERTWKKTNPHVQNVLFRLLREKDPTYAREFLAQRINLLDESRQDKFIDWIGQGNVYAEDEPFLESLLDHSNPAVAASAADCLRKLPNSAFVHRMKARVRNRVWVEQNAQGEQVLRWQPVTRSELDDTMRRDTVDREPFTHEAKPEIERLYYMLRCVPPTMWCEALSMSAKELVALGAKTPRLFIWGWARAVNVFGDSEWAHAIADYALMDEVNKHQLRLVIHHLPQERANEIILRMWQQNPLKAFKELSDFGGKQWDEAFSQQVISLYKQMIANSDTNDISAISSIIQLHTFRLHPKTITAAENLFEDYVHRQKTTDHVHKLQNDLFTLKHRARIWQAFTQEVYQ